MESFARVGLLTLAAGLIVLPASRVAADSPNYLFINYNSAKCMDVAHASISNGATVHQWTCHSGNHQQWRMVPDWYTDGYFMIVNKNSNKCLDVAGRSTAHGARVHQWACHNGANQHWSITGGPGGGQPVPGNTRYLLRNRHSGKCLEVTGASSSNGATLRQANCTAALNQIWLVAFP